MRQQAKENDEKKKQMKKEQVHGLQPSCSGVLSSDYHDEDGTSFAVIFFFAFLGCRCLEDPKKEMRGQRKKTRKMRKMKRNERLPQSVQM